MTPDDPNQSKHLCVTCVVRLNACKENQHNTTHNFKYWRARNARISPASSTTAVTVSQNERSLSSSASGTNDEMMLVTNGRTITPPLLSTMYWMTRETGDTESGGAFEKVQAKNRVRNQPQMCPYCSKSYQRESYLRRHVRKLHSASHRGVSAARLKRSKSLNDIPIKPQPERDAIHVILCPGCGKACAPNEVFHSLTCKKLQAKNQPTDETEDETTPIDREPERRRTRSMSRSARIPDEVQSVASLPTCVISPTTKSKRNSRKIITNGLYELSNRSL